MNWKKYTIQLLGRWQPWHKGHTELFKKAHKQTGQVLIMVKDVEGVCAGKGKNDNPFNYLEVKKNILKKLKSSGFRENKDFQIMLVPNIVDITYGRDVGYTFTQHDLGKQVHDISATKIRNRMRKRGEIKL